MKQRTTIQQSRRAVLGGIGATGLIIGLGAGIGAAQPDETPGGAAGQGDRSRRRPGHGEFDCPEGMEQLATFEFVTVEDDAGTVVACYFEQTEGDIFPVTITDYENKADEDCEPIAVTYESETHTIGQVSSVGGTDTHVDDSPEGGVYESDLENPGGQQAAISRIQFCGTEQVDASENGTTTDAGTN